MAATETPEPEISLVAGEKKKPNVLIWVVGALIFLLVVAVGGFIGYTQLSRAVAGYTGTGGEQMVEQRVKRLEVKGIISLDPFLVNLADMDSIRFLRATFQLGMAEVMKEAPAKDSIEMATMRDIIGDVLSSKTSEQIMTPTGKENLREEIRVLINDRLPKNRVAEVFIVDFVVQF